MTLEEIQNLAHAFPFVEEDIKWESHLCFMIGGKIFFVAGPENFPITATFKVEDEEYENYLSKPGCIPAPYLARYKWVAIEDIDLFSPSEWQAVIQKSFEIVTRKFATKKKIALGIQVD